MRLFTSAKKIVTAVTSSMLASITIVIPNGVHVFPSHTFPTNWQRFRPSCRHASCCNAMPATPVPKHTTCAFFTLLLCKRCYCSLFRFDGFFCYVKPANIPAKHESCLRINCRTSAIADCCNRHKCPLKYHEHSTVFFVSCWLWWQNLKT